MEVYAYLGGPRDLDELERLGPEGAGSPRQGLVVEHDGAAVGIVSFRRRERDRRGVSIASAP